MGRVDINLREKNLIINNILTFVNSPIFEWIILWFYSIR